MTDASIVYTINLIIGVILSAVMSLQRQLESSGRSLPSWVVAAWTLTGADLLFVLRSEWPAVVPRMVPTLVVTAGHAALVIAAHRTAGRPSASRQMVAVLTLHGCVLLGFSALPQLAPWRSVINSLLWGLLCVLAAITLRRAGEPARRTLAMTAVVLTAQATFFAGRTVLAIRAATEPSGDIAPLVQLLGDLEVSLFMVALFVSVLVAYLQLTNHELRTARDNVQQLSSMLPLCSWCHKVRDDAGYWKRLEVYFAGQRINVTHGICESCSTQHASYEAPLRSP